MEGDVSRRKYLKLLASNYKNIGEVTTEILRLSAMLTLPKGTEHFVSDIHGEDESFGHVLRNASGVIKDYIDELFGNTLMAAEKRNLATLVYYPADKLEHLLNKGMITDEWYRIQLFRLLVICKRTASKYTRAAIRDSLPSEFYGVLEELIFEDTSEPHKLEYYNDIVDNIINLGRAGDFIIAISTVIQHLAIDHLHVLGDIFDRGKGAAKVMDILQNYHSVDVQWGNHDISWMGAASGSDALICNVIRISAKYATLATIEEDYGINLVPLATLAMEFYADDPCERFVPEKTDGKTEKELDLIAKMHKAITIMQFKTESELIARHPEYRMDARVLLDKIDFEKKIVNIGGEEYPLADYRFPTIDPQNPLALSPEEQDVMDKIRFSFMNSTRLQGHVRFLFNHGSMYKIYNSNLLFHGGIPLDEDGGLKTVDMCGLKGRELLNKLDDEARRGYFAPHGSHDRQRGLDAMWYLWCGADSPLFGKNVMTTFERYFTDSTEIIKEDYNIYYKMRESSGVSEMILEEFGLDKSSSIIINGHTPVKVSKGESPVKAGGRMIVIDGGFAKAYQGITGIAGYTLISNSQGLLIAAHAPFDSAKDAIENEADILSDTFYVERSATRKKVSETDFGERLQEQIADLKLLLAAYRNGDIKER